MVERFNGRISDILTTPYFDSGKPLKQTLKRYAKIYNHVIPQKTIGHAPLIDALKVWYKKRADLFRNTTGKPHFTQNQIYPSLLLTGIIRLPIISSTISNFDEGHTKMRL